MHSELDELFSLSIDKISLTCNDTNSDAVERTCHRLMEIASRSFGELQVKSSRWHHLQCAMPIPNSTGMFVIQAGSRFADISDYRFEFNPSIIGREGLRYASSFIDSLTDIGAKALFANGKVTRIDIALDLPGLSLDEIVVRSLGQRKHAVYTGGKGRLETIYLGSGKANRTVVYTKLNQDIEFLRVERRMHPNIRGYQLSQFSNPFDKVQMISTNSLLLYLGGMIPQQFFDSVRIRGIGRVIAELPPGQRRAIRAALSDPDQSLLPSLPLVWSCWPNALNDCGLGRLCDQTGTSSG